jgi:hypothetical protein
MDVTDALIVAGGTVVLMGAGLMWVYRRLALAIDQSGDRVTQLASALALLTDTTETGFRDVSVEIGRLVPPPATARPARKVASTQRRVTTAARRGRTVRDIAADERLSEGEVRLRLNLDQPKEQAHAAVR